MCGVNQAFSDLERPPLDVAALQRALLGGSSGWREIDVVTETASTNADVAMRARAGESAGLVVVAEHQTRGRGRLDRAWTSPARSGLTMSVLLDPSGVPAERWSWLPLLAGVAVAEGVRRVTDVETALKWPNDVLVGGRKLAGILSERVQTPTGSAVVVGLGLNVTLHADELPTPDATSLLIEGARTTDRTVVLREVLRVLDSLYRAWLDDAGDPETGLAASYERRCSTLGREVRVLLPTRETLSGEAVRLDPQGRLVLRVHDEEHVVGAGDVVHVR